MIKKFSPQIYNSLVEIDEVRLNERYDKSLLPDLGRVILDCSWEKDVIISLVHRHFDLQANEKMVSDYNFQTREWISKPIVTDEDKLIPWNWKVVYDDKNKEYSLYPLDFLYDSPKFSEEKKTALRLVSDYSFLKNLSTEIVKQGVSDVFGIALLMSRFNDFTFDTVMFEKNDNLTRVSNSFFIPTATLNNPDAVTQWHFRGSALSRVGPTPLRWCDHS